MRVGDGYMVVADGYTADKLKRTAELPRREFVAVWVLLMTLHALCAAYLLAMARLYFFMEEPLMLYFSDLMALPEQRRFRAFGVAVGFLGGLHALQLMLHIGSSMQARALAVWPRTAVVKRGVEIVKGFSKVSERKVATSTSTHQKSGAVSRTLSTVENVVSIEGRYFELGFVLQKAVEVIAQINQCRHFSTLIARVWINQAFVGIVVANCLLTVQWNYLMLTATSRANARVATSTSKNSLRARTSSFRERTLCVAMDVLLSTISCLVLPLTIFVDWALQFDPAQWTFPVEVLYGDVAFVRLVYENQAIFALSDTDSIAKLVPHVSVLLSLSSISFILEKVSPNVGCSMKRVVVRSASSARQRSQRKSPYRAVPTTKLSTVVTFLQLALTSAGFFATAAVILKLHFQAKHLVSNADPSIRQMCLETVRPWFAQNVSCSVVKYNCYRHGVASPDHDIFENLQRDALTSIIFEHCSAFIMPASIRDFPNLLGIEIWNVTLVSWGSEAALNAELHPKMTFLIMSHANMTTLPQGVLSPPFPDLLSDIEITLTNLTRIPEEVENVWINLMVVYVENSALQEFPAPLFKLPVLDVSFTNCNLKELPEDLFTSDIYPGIYEELALSYNPIQTLPELARKGILIDQLSLSYTSLETLPSWIESDVSEAITLGGSPVCEDESAQMAEFVDCNNSGWDPLNSGSYPLAYVTSSRQL